MKQDDDALQLLRNPPHSQMIEREITETVSLTDDAGGLNPAALGWTRTPMHDTSGIPGHGRWGRNKRWEYWCVMTPTHIIALTVSCIDYLSLHSVWMLDRASGEAIDTTVLSPGARSATLPGSLGEGPARARTGTLTLDIDELGGGTRLRGTAPRVSFDITATRPQVTSRSASSFRGIAAATSGVSNTP